MSSAPPTPEPQNFDYTDLIRYYNRVFVGRVEDFVKKLDPSVNDANVMLLPMPAIKAHPLSPCKRVLGENVNLVPMNHGLPPATPARPFRYNLHRSPVALVVESTRLQEFKTINRMVRGDRPFYTINTIPKPNL